MGGSIITAMSYNEDGDLVITLEAGEGSTSYGRTLFHGSMQELINKLTKGDK